MGAALLVYAFLIGIAIGFVFGGARFGLSFLGRR